MKISKLEVGNEKIQNNWVIASVKTWFKNQQIEHKNRDLHVPELLSLPTYSEIVLVKTQNPQLCYYPDGVMVKLSVCQAVPTTACASSNPIWDSFFFFHCKLMLVKVIYMLGTFKRWTRFKKGKTVLQCHLWHYDPILGKLLQHYFSI